MRWKAKELEREEKRKAKKIEKAKWKYSKVDFKNTILNHLAKFRIIIFWGLAGKGKSVLMAMFAKWLVDRQKKLDKKNKRFNKYVNPKYVKALKKLEDNKKLPVYSNIDIHDENGFSQQDIDPVLKQQKQAIKGGVLAYDEIGAILGKDKYNYEQTEEDKKTIDTGRFIRHIGLWLLGTEQDVNNLWIGLRRFGYADVQALQTISYLSSFGKFKRRFQHFLLSIAPAFVFRKIYKTEQRLQLFIIGKIKTFFKALLPIYFSFPKNYYLIKLKIDEKIKNRHTRFKVLFELENKQYWLHFGSLDKYYYDSTYHEQDYLKQFDEEGNNIENKKHFQTEN